MEAVWIDANPGHFHLPWRLRLWLDGLERVGQRELLDAGLAEAGDVVGGDGRHRGGGGGLRLVPQIGDHGVDEGAGKARPGSHDPGEAVGSGAHAG
jgi:hypothetical protein